MGFAQSADVGDGIFATLVWSDPVHVAVPARHPLLSYKRIPLDEVLRYPLVMGDPQLCEGYSRHIERILRAADYEPLVVEHVLSFDLMMALAAAGFALALASATQIAASRESGIVARPLAGRPPVLTSYLLRLDAEPSESLARFIERVGAIEAPSPPARTDPSDPDSFEEIKP